MPNKPKQRNKKTAANNLLKSVVNGKKTGQRKGVDYQVYMREYWTVKDEETGESLKSRCDDAWRDHMQKPDHEEMARVEFNKQFAQTSLAADSESRRSYVESKCVGGEDSDSEDDDGSPDADKETLERRRLKRVETVRESVISHLTIGLCTNLRPGTSSPCNQLPTHYWRTSRVSRGCPGHFSVAVPIPTRMVGSQRTRKLLASLNTITTMTHLYH